MAAATGGAGLSHGECFTNVTVRPSVTPPTVTMELHAENRQRLVAALAATAPGAHNLILVAGGAGETRHDTDHEPMFRQESNFHWLFGVKEPDCLGLIETDTGRAHLLVPFLPEAYAVWMGEIKTLEQWKELYAVDAVHFTKDIAAVVAAFKPAAIQVLHGFNSDGKKYTVPATFEGIDAYTQEKAALWPAVAELRVHKTAREVELLRYIVTLSSEAHLAVMQHCRGGLKEYQLESVFKHFCQYHGGARYLSYTCICATGHNASVLHYGHAGEPNAKLIKDGDLCLFDMGSEFHCYGSDITCSFPANGKFTPDQKIVYEAVLGAQVAVLDALKPGVSWVDMHTLAYRTILTHLKEGGLVTGDVDAMLAVNLGAVFMPHGLGHFLGIDTHDVGGYLGDLKREEKSGYASLRTVRLMEAGMFLTVEPGVYFIDHLLDAALANPAQAPFLHAAAIARFRGTGGVRLEDDVLITETGCDNFTHAPRTVADVEAVLAGTITQRSQLTKFH